MNSFPEIMKKYKGKIDGVYITSGFSRPLCEYMEKEGLSFSLVAFDILLAVLPRFD